MTRSVLCDVNLWIYSRKEFSLYPTSFYVKNSSVCKGANILYILGNGDDDDKDGDSDDDNVYFTFTGTH